MKQGIWVEKLWRRIGQDGLPPLAKFVVRDGEPVARIVDETEYADFGGQDGPQCYTAWFIKGGLYFTAGEFTSFEAALENIIARLE